MGIIQFNIFRIIAIYTVMMKRYMKYLNLILSQKKSLTGMMCALVAMLSLSSCDKMIYEEAGDCDPKYYVKYVFDMNMSYADAFASKVNSVTLFVIEPSTGNIVASYEAFGDPLKEPGYRMPIDVAPGEYEFIAWCGLENNDDLFTLPASVSHREHVHCRMARTYNEEGRAMQNNWLHSLFHGKISAGLPDTPGDHEVTIYLIKDTNNINISMQHVAGQPLTKDMFSVTMTEGNGHMAYDNSLVLDEDIDFHPWHIADGNVDLTTGRADDEVLNYFKAEISTPRLMAERDPRINIVDNESGNTLYSIPIVQWALAFKSAQHSGMGNQEYLDREDEFNVMLYLDNKDESGWLAASIYINGWRIVNHDDTEMGN